MMKAWHCAVPALCALLFAQHVARADDKPAERQADNPNTALALQKFDEGRKELELGNHAAALAAFEASNSLLASPNSLLYIARCHKALGHTASAYTTFRLALKQSQDRLVATGDNRYIATRDSASREASQIETSVPKLAIVVPAEVPPGFVVRRNGVAVAHEALGNGVDTDPGHVVVEASGPRLQPFRVELDLADGETKRVDVTVARLPTATIRLKFAARPLGLSVLVDGQPVDTTAFPDLEVDPGEHTVQATAPGHMPFRWAQTLTDGVTSEVRVQLQIAPTNVGRATPSSAPQTISFVTAGTLGAGAIVFGILTINALRDLRDLRDAPVFLSENAMEDAEARARRFALTTDVLTVGAIVSGALGLYFTLHRKPSPRASAAAF